MMPGVLQHVIQQGHNREPCFYAIDDYWRYRSDLDEVANANQVAIHAYRELFNQHLEKAEVHAIRTALNQELVLGREDFKDKIETMLKRQVRPGIPGRPRIEDLSAIYYVY